jgi:hypothetical protein
MDFKKFFSFNSNTAFKLLEISYYGVLALIFTLVATIILENESIIPFLFKTYNYEDFPIYVILEDIITDTAFFVIVLYFIRKLLHKIPFVFARYNKKYVSGIDAPVKNAIDMIMGLVVFTTMDTLLNKLKVLDIKVKQLTNTKLADNTIRYKI